MFLLDIPFYRTRLAAYSQRPYGAHDVAGRAFPGLRCAPSGAILLLSLREERQRVEVYRLPPFRQVRERMGTRLINAFWNSGILLGCSNI